MELPHTSYIVLTSLGTDCHSDDSRLGDVSYETRPHINLARLTMQVLALTADPGSQATLPGCMQTTRLRLHLGLCHSLASFFTFLRSDMGLERDQDLDDLRLGA